MFVEIRYFSLRYACVFLGICLGLGSCRTSAAVHQQMGQTNELAGHIRYLCQPALKGRKTRSAGARLARRYIKDRF